jgi:peroxiredoxin
VDPAEDGKYFSEKIGADGKGPINFPLLSDPQHRVIDTYGLQDPRYFKQKREGIPYPTTVVIDKAGRVAWVRIDHNTTIRPPNSEIRAALDALR